MAFTVHAPVWYLFMCDVVLMCISGEIKMCSGVYGQLAHQLYRPHQCIRRCSYDKSFANIELYSNFVFYQYYKLHCESRKW